MRKILFNLYFSLNPKGNGEVVPPTPQQNGVSYPKISSPTHDYENLIRVIPTRKAPKPPAPTPLNTSTYATLATHQGNLFVFLYPIWFSTT